MLSYSGSFSVLDSMKLYIPMTVMFFDGQNRLAYEIVIQKHTQVAVYFLALQELNALF